MCGIKNLLQICTIGRVSHVHNVKYEASVDEIIWAQYMLM